MTNNETLSYLDGLLTSSRCRPRSLLRFKIAHHEADMLNQIAAELYVEDPASTLYHYTSLNGMMSIVSENSIWASEAHYLNDASELNHFARWLDMECSMVAEKTVDPETVIIIDQLRTWIKFQTEGGPMIFVTSFTENGNLLSQWRGYCKHGQGVSLGFRPATLPHSAERQKFSLGKCIYDSDRKLKLAERIVDAMRRHAMKKGRDKKSHASQTYWHSFQMLEADLLRISILIKDRAFQEENEWRVVSPVLTNYVEPEIFYRAGPAMLVPYLKLALQKHQQSDTLFEQTYLGPTANENLAMDSLSRYLSRSGACNKVVNSRLPYRG